MQPKPQTSARRPSRSFSVPAEGRLRDGRPRQPGRQPVGSNWAQDTLQTPELEQCQSSSPSGPSADDVQAMKEFVQNEEARLRALTAARGAELASSPLQSPPHLSHKEGQKDLPEGPRTLDSGYRLSWEEQPQPQPSPNLLAALLGIGMVSQIAFRLHSCLSYVLFKIDSYLSDLMNIDVFYFAVSARFSSEFTPSKSPDSEAQGRPSLESQEP